MQRNKSYLWRLIAAFIFASIFFLLIFSVAYGASYLNYMSIKGQTNVVQEYLKEMSSFVNNSVCSPSLVFEASIRLDDAGARIGLLEERIGKNDARVLEQKKIYSEIELKHFEIVKFLRDKCNADYLPVLFFYSNSEEFKDASESMGYILGAFKNEHKNKAMIYSFDSDLESDSISLLKAGYNITKVPAVLVNERYLVYPTNINELEEYLK
jgi:hypothetical protein